MRGAIFRPSWILRSIALSQILLKVVRLPAGSIFSRANDGPISTPTGATGRPQSLSLVASTPSRSRAHASCSAVKVSPTAAFPGVAAAAGVGAGATADGSLEGPGGAFAVATAGDEAALAAVSWTPG